MALLARFLLAWAVIIIGPIAWMIHPGIDKTISPATMTPGGGFTFSAPVEPPPLFERRPDSAQQQGVSRLRIFEDGRELGPAHAVHATIKDMGRGAFSDWADQLYFSTSDGTDPRTNARRYTVQFPAYPNRTGQMVLLGLPAVIIAAMVFGGALAASVHGALHSRRALTQLVWLILAYSFALILIDSSLLARQSTPGAFKINFEYKVF